MNDALLRLVLILIAIVTVVTGLAQMIVPSTILGIIARGTTGLSTHVFATVGMFMVVTGAMFLQALLTRSAEKAVPLWIGVQKAAAAVLLVWAVMQDLFTPLALGVAAFDAASAVLAFLFLSRMPR